MSFYASNNRIRVLDGSATVFDTNQPMPHILQTIVKNGVAVSFPHMPSELSHSHQTYHRDAFENECSMKTVCGYVEECSYKFVDGTMQYVCENVYRCRPENVCEIVRNTYSRTECWVTALTSASEWEQVHIIGDVTNGINADFIIVNASGSRSTAGSDNDYGAFISGLPSGTFMCQGSAILEGAFFSGGSSWLQRIMSIYVENGQIKVKFKHSNRLHNSLSSSWTQGPEHKNNSFPPQVHATMSHTSKRSDFTFNFTVYVGKFN